MQRSLSLPILGALLAVYLIWGSTYFVLGLAVKSLPPFELGAIRFLLAGTLTLIWARSTGLPLPTWPQLRFAAGVGVVMFIGGMGGVTLSQAAGVGSGLVATIVATTPLWVAIFSGLWGRWPGRGEWLGTLLGLAGVALLSFEGDFRTGSIWALVVFIAPIFWSFGTVWGRHVPQPPGMMASAVQMLAAGLAFIPFSWLLGEQWVWPAAEVWGSLAYLIVMGTLVAFNAFNYLLNHVRPALATSYAYVNPAVAVVIGVGLGGEVVTAYTWIALPIILAGVIIVSLAAQARPAR